MPPHATPATQFYQEGFTYDMATNDFSYDVDLITAVNKQDYFDNFKKAISTIP